MQVVYGRTPLVFGRRVRRPAARVLAATPTLIDVSLATARRAGGRFVRRVLDAMAIRGDRRHAVVQVVIDELAPGEVPNGAGWHVDGVADGRGGYRYTTARDRDRPDRFHLLIIGDHCRTRFVRDPLALPAPRTDDPRARRAHFTRLIERLAPPIVALPTAQIVEYDGWTLHTAVPATAAGWRAFIRVAETDHHAPRG